jgi:purine-cytosine permease-like protein
MIVALNEKYAAYRGERHDNFRTSRGHPSIEPIPGADWDSTGLQQMWIWAGANIAPVNWALGALGIILKLGLLETIAVIVIATQ